MDSDAVDAMETTLSLQCRWMLNNTKDDMEEASGTSESRENRQRSRRHLLRVEMMWK